MGPSGNAFSSPTSTLLSTAESLRATVLQLLEEIKTQGSKSPKTSEEGLRVYYNSCAVTQLMTALQAMSQYELAMGAHLTKWPITRAHPDAATIPVEGRNGG